MVGQMERQIYGGTDRWKDRQMEGKTNERNGHIEGQGRTDSWEEWTYRKTGRWKN